MKIYKWLFAVATAFCMQAAQADTIIDGTFANGNGSFEFDESGVALGTPGTPGGGWVDNGDTALTIDGTDAIGAIDTLLANDQVASVGTYSLVVAPDANPASGQDNLGGILNTGYIVGASDEFSFSFDWQKTDNYLGAANFDVFVFTSSDDTLSGTLTSIYKGTFGSGPAMSAFESVALTSGDFTITGANVGQQLWVAFAGGGYTGASNSSRLNIDNLSLTVVPEPATLGLVVAFGGGVLFIRRRLMM